MNNLKHLVKEGVSLNVSEIEAFLLSMSVGGKKGTYINAVIDSVRVYGHFVGDSGLEGIKKYSEEKPVKAIMSDSEIESFLELDKAPNCNQEAHDKWKLYFSILAFTGMRPGECAKLTAGDCDFGTNLFTLRDTKTHDNRNVPIPPMIAQPLQKLISVACRVPDDYLFPSSRGGNKDGLGKHIDNVDWHYNFHTRIKKLGIKRRGLTPHSLRHSFITSMLSEDVALPKVMKLVGHRRIETTFGYTHLVTKDIQEAIKKLPLIRKHIDPNEIINALEEHLRSLNLDEDRRLKYSVTKNNKKLNFEIEVITDS